MKKIIALLVVICFLVAAMPRPVYAGNGSKLAAIGIVSGLIAGLVWLSGRRDQNITQDNNKTQNEMHKREEATTRLLGAPKAMGGPGVVEVSGGGIEGGKVSWNRYPPQPTTLTEAKEYGFLQAAQPAQPTMPHKTDGNDGGKNSFWQAGYNAAQTKQQTTCTGSDYSDYCEGYRAGERR
ncbi:MAG: hypothetical protein AAB604_01150 [Patescibacteria group bacterium]